MIGDFVIEKRPAVIDRTNPRVSVVIPALNEAMNLPHVFARIPSTVYEVILVDGHSSDGTMGVARRLLRRVRLVRQNGQGKGNALACGFAAAHGDIIVMLDADGSTDPAEIPRFVAALQEGADFVKGSRFLPSGGSDDITRLRTLGNLALTALVNALYGAGYTDLCYGYNAFWRNCLDHVVIDCDGFEVETLMNIRVAKTRLTVREISSHEARRLHGVSNLQALPDGWRVLKTIFRERLPVASRLPHVQLPFLEVSPEWDGIERRRNGDRRRPSPLPWTGVERRTGKDRRATVAATIPSLAASPVHA